MTSGGNSFSDFPKLYQPEKSQPKQRRLFSFSRRWPWHCFLNGSNAAASTAPTLVRRCTRAYAGFWLGGQCFLAAWGEDNCENLTTKWCIVMYIRIITLTLVFIKKGFYSSNNVVRYMAKLFSVSDEFRRLCTNVDMYPHSIDVTPILVLRCSVYRNFTMTWLWTSRPTFMDI